MIVILFLIGILSGTPLEFTDVTQASGITFRHEDGRTGKKYYLETLGAGAAWFDYDRDGDLDIYFVNGADLGGMQSVTPPTNALYRNEGNGTFTDVTVEAGVGDTAYGFSCAIADYDNDGFQDIYVANYGADVLYHNNGNGTFANVTKLAGIDNPLWAAAGAFADYDNDGYVDLYIANYVTYDIENDPNCNRQGINLHCSPDVFEGTAGILYRNNGDGTFVDVTEEAGLNDSGDKRMGIAWGDYDNDGDMDLVVANDRTPDRLYQNQGDGTFVDTGLLAGIALSDTGNVMSSMATILSDIDNDGWLDLIVTNFHDEPNSVFHNDGTGFFSDITYQSGIGGRGLNYLSWGADAADFDNDGYVDIVIANGHLDENIKEARPSLSYAQPNQLFINNGDRTFDEVSDRAGMGLKLEKVSRGVALGDYDNDGDVDILVTNCGQKPDLLRNDTASKNHWLVFETVGTKSNRDGIGTRIKVLSGGMWQIREVKSGGSYPCHSDMRLYFGLGQATTAERIEIHWPSGLVEQFEQITTDQFLRVEEGRELKHLPLEHSKE